MQFILCFICLLASLVTGLVIEFGPKEYKHTMEEIHELSIYYLLGFIIIHFSGILIAEFTSEKGIISRVIGGDKKA
jgi:cytochrome b